MAILESSLKTDHDLTYHTTSIDTNEHSFVSGFCISIAFHKEALSVGV